MSRFCRGKFRMLKRGGQEREGVISVSPGYIEGKPSMMQRAEGREPGSGVPENFRKMDLHVLTVGTPWKQAEWDCDVDFEEDL